jgi:hypothetical protein
LLTFDPSLNSISYRLIATMDGYKSVDMELKLEKDATQSSVVMLEKMAPVTKSPIDPSKIIVGQFEIS